MKYSRQIKRIHLFRKCHIGRLKKYHQAQKSDLEGDYFIQIGFRINELRRHLSVDEASYLRVAGQAFADSRSYYIYTALDEIHKSHIYLVRQKEYLQGSELSPRRNRLERLVQTQVLDESNAHIRKLLELLVNLILFTKCNEQIYFKHLLLLERLNNLLSQNKDFEDFYEKRSLNITSSIERQILTIREIETAIDLDKCWYLRSQNPLPEMRKLRPGGFLSSIKARIDNAIPLIPANERLLFGFTYSAFYGLTSKSIHYNTIRSDYRFRDGEEQIIPQHIGLLIVAILVRCHELMGRPEAPSIQELPHLLSQTNAPDLAHTITVREIKIGDFVLANGYLAEVIDIHTSKYGYRSYKISFLVERPIAEIQEDWLPAMYVQPFYTRDIFILKCKEMAKNGKLSLDTIELFDSLSQEKLKPILRNSIIQVWNIGLRDWVYGQCHNAE